MGIFKGTWLLWAALGAIVIGFVTLAGGKLSIGPQLLIAGYCVLLPFYLWTSFRRNVGE